MTKNPTQIELIKEHCWVVAERARWSSSEIGSSSWKETARGPVFSVSLRYWLLPKAAKFQILHLHVLMSRGRKFSSCSIWEEVVHFSFPETPANVASGLLGLDWFKGPSLNQSQWPEEMGEIWEHRPIRGYLGTRGKFNPTRRNEGRWFPEEILGTLRKGKGRVVAKTRTHECLSRPTNTKQTWGFCFYFPVLAPGQQQFSYQ